MPLRDVSTGTGAGTYSVHYNDPINPNSHGNYTTQPDDDYEKNDAFSSSFSNKAIRTAFVRKVYMILMVQLSVTVAFIALFLFHDGVKKYVQNNRGWYWSAYVIFLVTYIALVCCPTVRRKFPANFIMLGIFTLAMSYMAAMISSYHKTEVVLITMGITAAVCLGVTLFSIQTKWDITGMGGYLFVAGLVVMLIGIVAIIVGMYYKMPIVYVVYSGVAALLFCVYLMYDTQQIIGGRKIEISPEEHIYGALQLYLDMIYIFLHLLNIVSHISNN